MPLMSYRKAFFVSLSIHVLLGSFLLFHWERHKNTSSVSFATVVYPIQFSQEGHVKESTHKKTLTLSQRSSSHHFTKKIVNPGSTKTVPVVSDTSEKMMKPFSPLVQKKKPKIERVDPHTATPMNQPSVSASKGAHGPHTEFNRRPTLPKSQNATTVRRSSSVVKRINHKPVISSHQVTASSPLTRGSRTNTPTMRPTAHNVHPVHALSVKKPKHSERSLEQKTVSHLKEIKKANEQKRFLVAARSLESKRLQEQMVEEQKQLASQRASQLAEEMSWINRYKSAIVGSIEKEWIVPEGANRQLSCILNIRLSPEGKVLSVEILQSSGDATLDQSARVAVLKASPLPVPKDSDLFNTFKELRLRVQPLHVSNF